MSDEFEEEQVESQGDEIIIGTVDSVTADGVTIIVDGDDVAGQKEYKVNCGVVFSSGDRVKLTRNSGTYIVDYVIGSPMERFPLPSGGSTGQVLTKASNSNYDVKWSSASGIPSGGSTGQYLMKSSSTDYAVSWSDVITSNLKSGNSTLYFTGSTLYPSGTCSLGTNSSRFNGCYLLGSMFFGNNASKLGFFGTTPISQAAVANNATVATLITALKQYGLIR